MGVALQSLGTGLSIASAVRHGATGARIATAGHTARKETRGMIRWLMLACGAAMLAGCVSPTYPAYPTPIYPPPYVTQPPYAVQPPGPVPLYPTPEPRQEVAPPPEDVEAPVGVPEPAPEFMPEPDPPEAANPVAPIVPTPEIAVPSPPPSAGPGADVLQGFRPMRGQTRPGI